MIVNCRKCGKKTGKALQTYSRQAADIQGVVQQYVSGNARDSKDTNVIKVCLFHHLLTILQVVSHTSLQVYFDWLMTFFSTVRPLLSADLDYLRFLRPKFSTPNSFEVQLSAHYLCLYHPRTSIIRSS